MKSDSLLLLAQAAAQGQSEYIAAYALIVAAVILGLVVICIPRGRGRFIEPEEEDSKSQKSKKRR